MTGSWDPAELRATLSAARLMLVFSPELCGERDPLEVLGEALAHVDVVQVRPKPLGAAGQALTEARAAHDWSLRVLALVRERAEKPLPVIVNDRVDVARALWREGLAGVHVGTDDTPPAAARETLGAGPLIGFSTHSVGEAVRACEEPVDYLGFGPIHATTTKGYARGLGPEPAWVANTAAPFPVFPIGGIDRSNANELAEVGRAAVGAAVLAANDPAAAARELRALLAREA